MSAFPKILRMTYCFRQVSKMQSCRNEGVAYDNRSFSCSVAREALFQLLQRNEVSVHDCPTPHGLNHVRDHLFHPRPLEVFADSWKRTRVELNRSSINKLTNNTSPYGAPYTIRTYK